MSGLIERSLKASNFQTCVVPRVYLSDIGLYFKLTAFYCVGWEPTFIFPPHALITCLIVSLRENLYLRKTKSCMRPTPYNRN